MQVIAKYSRSVNSSNLKDDAHHHATEALAAVALSSELGGTLFRVKYSNSAGSYDTLMLKWREIVKNKSISRNWPQDIAYNDVARLSLNYWLHDICPACVNGHQPLPGIPNVLSDDDCPMCNGTARRPIAAHHKVIKYVTDMVECIEEMTRHAGGQAIRKLATEMEL